MVSLGNIKTANKLILGFGLVCGLFLLQTIVSWRVVSEQNGFLDTTMNQSAKAVKVATIKADMASLYAHLEGLTTAPTAAKKQAHATAIADARTEYRKLVDELKAVATQQADRDLLAKLELATASGRDVNQRIAEMALKADGLDLKALDLFETEGRKGKENIDSVVKDLLAYRGLRMQQTDDASNEGMKHGQRLMIALLLVALGLSVLSGFLITRNIVGPIQICVEAMKKFAAGDLTARAALNQKDELGILANAINESTSHLRDTISAITTTITKLQQSAASLTDVARTEAAGAEETNAQAVTVASAGEQLATNAKLMAGSAEDINRSASTVAAAIEEMSASIQEVARNCSKESQIAQKADVQARGTRDLMVKLDESATAIGKVVELINRIAEQTNLLALNATIEAASAGDAGRGFAVVANEVKELARQSATATEEIRGQINLIQENAGNSTRAIDEVATVIQEVSSIAASIAAAVEEQSATTSEIVRTLHTVTSATTTLSENVRQTANASSEVSRNIHGVSDAAAEASRGAVQISASARELTAFAADLAKVTAQFKN